MTHPSDFFGDDPPATPAPAFTHTAALWRWTSPGSDAPAAWFFVTIDGETADAIRAVAGMRRGFGSVRVAARIGGTRWETSIFPQKDVGGFMLPVKASVRKAERLAEGSLVTVELLLDAQSA
jgi:hypothetical protein